MNTAITFLRNNPARAFAIAVAALAVVAFYVPALPVALYAALAAAVLGVGEGVQRVENRKSNEAAVEGAAFAEAEADGSLYVGDDAGHA